MNTAGIILAGAHVWKDDAFDALCPRLLLPIANVPLIFHTLDWLRAGGVTRVVLCINEHSEVVRHTIDEACDDQELDYYVDRVPRGPAGCARDAAQIAPADQYVVLEGGVLPSFPLREVLGGHEQAGACVSVVVDNSGGGHTAWGLNGSPAGVYVLARAALQEVSPSSYQDLKEGLVRQLLQRGDPVHALASPQAPLASARPGDVPGGSGAGVGSGAGGGGRTGRVCVGIRVVPAPHGAVGEFGACPGTGDGRAREQRCGRRGAHWASSSWCGMCYRARGGPIALGTLEPVYSRTRGAG